MITLLLYIFMSPIYIVCYVIKFFFYLIGWIISGINKLFNKKSNKKILSYYCNNCNLTYTFNGNSICTKCGNLMKIIYGSGNNRNEDKFQDNVTLRFDLNKNSENADVNTLYRQYSKYFEKHRKLSEEIGVKYSIARNTGPGCNEYDECIKLCFEDIELANYICKYYSELKKIGYKYAIDLKEYPTFKKLAILLEDRKQYEDAIIVCQKAIALGLNEDGTDGKMQGRIARLKRKSNNNTNKGNILLVDEETGEVLKKITK